MLSDTEMDDLRWKADLIGGCVPVRPEELRQLLDEIARLRAENDRLREELDEAAGHRCAYAQGAHGIAGCGKCFDCVRRENDRLRAGRLTRKSVVTLRSLAYVESNYQALPTLQRNAREAVADLDRAYPPEEV